MKAYHLVAEATALAIHVVAHAGIVDADARPERATRATMENEYCIMAVFSD